MLVPGQHIEILVKEHRCGPPVERFLSAAKYCTVAFLPTALCVLASSSPILAQTFPMSVTCDSGGQQICTPVFSTPIAVTQTSALSITVTASPTHCSNVGYIVALDANVLSTTAFLAPGQSSGPMASAPVSSGQHTVTVHGIGTVSGCNAGTLGSWSGTLAISQITNTPTGANVSVPLSAVNVDFANITAPGTTQEIPGNPDNPWQPYIRE